MSRRLHSVLAAAALTSGAACGEHGEATALLAMPSSEGFGAVSAVLEPNCGTLDCHGAPARNLRVYGKRGLRFDGSHVTGAAVDTTPREIEATYHSILGLQPEVLSQLFAERGRDPQRWIVITKARGLENHVGKDRLPSGSPGDRCLVSWASGTLDQAACGADAFGPVPRPGEVW
jgi:hypothetical protein